MPERLLNSPDLSLRRMARFFAWQKEIREAMVFRDTFLQEADVVMGVLEKLGTLLKADRCVLVELNDGQALPVRYEYRSDPHVFSYLNLVPPWGHCPFLGLAAGLEFAFTSDVMEDDLVKADAGLVTFFKTAGVRGGIACPVVYQNNLLSAIAIHTKEPRRWEPEELSLVMVAADQLALATVVASKQRIQEAARASLAESEARFRRVVDSDIIGIVFWNKTLGQITHANDAFLEMTGYSRDELEGGQINWREMTPPEYAHLDVAAFEEMDAHPKGKCEPYEKQYLHKNGSRIDILLAVAYYEDSRDAGVAFILDITARKRAERVLRETAQRLEQSNRELEQFATVASHDLQAPLRKLLNFSHALVDTGGELNEEQRQYVDRMQRAAARMQELITDLLDLSRVTRKGMPFRAVSLARVLAEVQEDLLYDGGCEDGRMELGAVNVSLEADAAQLQQLFRNLVDNAFKFRRPEVPPVVHIEAATADDGFCEITVADNGIGFEEKYADRIFGIFERLVKNTEYEGTGIGLALCRKIVERHGGDIQAKGVPGEGATFIIRLPLRQL